jgi:hypothetical protein
MDSAAHGRRIASYSAEGVSIVPLMSLIIMLVIVGVGLYLVNNYIPMDAKIKNILNVVVVVAVCVWLLQATGMMGSLSSYRIGR